MQAEVQAPTFGKLRSFLWPIHGHEYQKLIPMFCLFFLIAFVYNVLRCMKVTLVVTETGAGADIIPFLKVWAVLPGAVILTYLYTVLANRLSREQVFYTMVSLFLGFFVLFMFVLHPHQKALELTRLSHYLASILPNGSQGFIALIQHWPLTIFYVLGEMWSAIVLSMLFWGFANEVTSVDEAKRFYAIFALGANSSGIFSGLCAKSLTLDHYIPWLPFGSVAWEQSLILQLSVVLLLGVVIMILYRYVNRSVLTKTHFYHQPVYENYSKESDKKTASKKDKKETLSLRECCSQLINSRYMMYIAILVVAYNIVYNISDVLWTAEVNKHYPNPSDFNAYINTVAFFTGVFATLSALLLSGNIIRRYGWTATAMITPILWFVTAVGFLGCLLLSEFNSFSEIIAGLFSGMPFYSLALIFGSTQICLGRAAKYTVFDESKEIAFIPLPKEQQRKGKAVIDGIASRFGKSGGSLMIQFLMLNVGSLVLSTPYLSAILFIALIFWMIAVLNLGKLAKESIDREVYTSANSDADVDAGAIKGII